MSRAGSVVVDHHGHVAGMGHLAQRIGGGAQLAQLMFPRFAAGDDHALIAKGMNASPGAAVGRVVFDSSTAVKWAASGEKVILVRRETNPDDLEGMIAAAGILTSRGGKTSHAAVVARQMGKVCLVGCRELAIDLAKRSCSIGGKLLREGQLISLDGGAGDDLYLVIPTSATTEAITDSAGSDLLAIGGVVGFTARNTGTGLYRYGALAAFSVSGSHRNGVRFSITQNARPCVLIARSSSRSIMSLTGTGGRFFCRLFQFAPASCDTYTPRSVAAYTMPAATGVAQAGIGLGAFSTSTRHMRQLAAMLSFLW